LSPGHAWAIARTALLLGLNCGFYAGNITTLTDEMFDGKHVPQNIVPKLFPPTVRAVKEIVPNKLIPRLKPMTPLKPRPPLG
jgi:hypothetical protein